MPGPAFFVILWHYRIPTATVRLWPSPKGRGLSSYARTRSQLQGTHAARGTVRIAGRSGDARQTWQRLERAPSPTRSPYNSVGSERRWSEMSLTTVSQP
jgi:hypothetical protein